MIHLRDVTIAIVGLGYVGLPLAVEFSKRYPVIGYDINAERVEQLKAGEDITLELDSGELGSSGRLTISNSVEDIAKANVYIVTVPTPVDQFKQPDLEPVISATKDIACVLKSGDVVIYESTVYPGATEEECIPILERMSGLSLNKEFFVGYSPERINPGDRHHRLVTIRKITSGSTPEAALFVDDLYSSILIGGTYQAPSIKVAEAAKVIENTQRNVNIALMNELAKLFSKLNIDTEDVLLAAESKWNFLHFRPGLVGGHCISVDPHYLIHKAEQVGVYPEITLAGSRINDSMGLYVASQLAKAMARKGIPILNSRALILGLTFKENTPDLRNTKVIDIVRELQEFGMTVDVYDPWADPEEAKTRYGITLVETLFDHTYSGIILAVAHKQFQDLTVEDIEALRDEKGTVVYDLKYVLPRQITDIRL